MSDLADFLKLLNAHALPRKWLDVVVAAFEEIEAKRREKHRDLMRRVRSRDVTQRKEEEEVQVFSESYFVSDDKTFTVSPEEFAAWAVMFPTLKPERIMARWRALYKSWLCTLDPDQRKRAFENKIAKDLRDKAEKDAKVVKLRVDEAKPERLRYWEDRTARKGG